MAGLLNRIKKNAIISTIISFVQAIWFPLVIGCFGGVLGLASEDGKLSSFGWFITIFIYAIILTFLIIKSVLEKKETDKITELENKNLMFKSSAELYYNLLTVLKNICLNKYRTLLKYVVDTERKQYAQVISSPKVQIVKIIDELKNAVFAVTKVKNNQLTATIAYRIPAIDDAFHWIDDSYANGGLSIDVLSSDPKTTFFKVAQKNRQNRFKYFNNKNKAALEGNYLADTRDNATPKGSIMCYYINAGSSNNSDPFIESVISIATYGQMIVSDDDSDSIERTKENFESSILPEFEERLLYELLLLYIEKISEKKPVEKVQNK